MSVSGRRRSSKWDLKDEQRHSYGNARGIPRHEKEDMSLRDRELEQGWFSPEVASRNRDRWPSMEARDVTRPKHALPSKESFHGNRSSYDSDRIATDVATRHVGDESYIMKTSRDVDDWRLEKRRRSPRNDWTSAHRSRSRSWSRSRSRSPFQNFRRQSGVDDRSRSRSGAHPPVCRDFASGRCRRGNQCQFLHQDVQNHEDNWDSRHRNNGAPKYSASHDSKGYHLKNVRSTCIDFLKGDCRRAASCRFVHDNDSDGLGRVNEATREKGNDRRIRSPERDGERESRKSSDIPCKYFSAGNCRNGRHCRFSHHGQLRPSPEKRLLDDNREQGRNSVSAENMRDGPKWSSQDSSNEKEKAWNGPTWSEKDALSDRDAITKLDETWTGPKWTGDKDENVSVSEPRLSGWSDDSGWQNGPDVNRGHSDSRVNVSMVSSSMTDSPNINVHVSEQRIAEASLDDMEMSPDWNFRIETSKNIGKIEHPQLPQSSKLHETSVLTHGQNTTKDTSGQTRDLPLILEPKSSERSYFQQDSLLSDGSAVTIPYSDTNVTGRSDLNFSGNSVPTQSALTYSSSHSVGQNRLGVPSVTLGGTMDISQSRSLFPEINLSNASTIGNTNMSQVSSAISSQSMVSDEQLTQLSNLTASLAQILGNTQQLPQLPAALNSHNTIQGPPFSNSGAMPGGTTQPDLGLAVKLNHDIASQQQYDPLSDSIESTKKNLSMTSLGLATLPVEQKFTDEQHNRPRSEKGQIFESHQSDQRNAAANSVQTNENNAAGAGEIKKDPEDKNSGPAEYVDGDEKAEESKKNKDSKGIRPFKFALAEFVKDLLKPTWKEGQISKEAYKNIVKKVVDKVTATVQGASIPQTQEKIDQYLSSSKPKLNKLVQAYVEKSQKAK